MHYKQHIQNYLKENAWSLRWHAALGNRQAQMVREANRRFQKEPTFDNLSALDTAIARYCMWLLRK